METFVVYINDKSHAMNQVLPLLEASHATQWVLVACPPRLNRHTGKWLTQRAQRKFREDWTQTNLKELVELLTQRHQSVVTRVAHQSLLQFTKTLRAEFGQIRIVDARRPRAIEGLPAVVAEQKQEARPWAIPVGAVALGAAVTLAVE
jgi:hypothetical protein